jgi:DNA-binding SARP family transcriptional activator
MSARRAQPPSASLNTSLDSADLIEQLPFGVLVTNARGVVVFANPAATELLGLSSPVEGETCCRLFGCGRDGTPLEKGCVTQLAARSQGALPEIRLDTPDGEVATWITARSVGGSRQVVIHVRPGMRGDRRRRTQPHWIGEHHLHIKCLGPLRIENDAASLGGGWTQRRAGQVLTYLLCERHRGVHPEELVEALWPDAGPAGLGRVRYYVHVLRDRLEPQRERRTASTFIEFDSSGYRFNPLTVEIDADAFEREINAGLQAASGRQPGTEKSLRRALDLYSGDFLDDHRYAVWAQLEQDRLHSLAVAGLRELVKIRSACGDEDEALRLRTRLAEMEPLDDTVHRDLIMLDLRERRHSEAVRRFEALSKRMQSELGRKPEFDLSELAATI